MGEVRRGDGVSEYGVDITLAEVLSISRGATGLLATAEHIQTGAWESFSDCFQEALTPTRFETVRIVRHKCLCIQKIVGICLEEVWFLLGIPFYR
jgi:hypothetical protein